MAKRLIIKMSTRSDSSRHYDFYLAQDGTCYPWAHWVLALHGDRCTKCGEEKRSPAPKEFTQAKAEAWLDAKLKERQHLWSHLFTEEST